MNLQILEAREIMNHKKKTELYGATGEAIQDGLEVMKDPDEDLELLRREVCAGFAEVGQGEFSEYELNEIGALLSAVKERGRNRLEAEIISGF